MADKDKSGPDPWIVMEQMATAIQALSEKMGTAPSTDKEMLQAVVDKLSPALERMADAQIEGAKIQASEQRHLHRPSNEVVPKVSVFNRRGENLPDDAEGPRKQPLKCIMMIPWLAEWDSLTREEVDLLNLLEAGIYTVTRIDRTKVRVTVNIDYREDGVTPSRLLMNHDTAFNNDNFRMMPDLAGMLRQILKQHDSLEVRKLAAVVLSDDEEEAMIEAGALTISR